VTLCVAAESEERYRFEVSDTGPGLTPEDRAVVFEAFRQGVRGAQAGGAGLGLSIARRYVELMGGELSVASSPGQGATFAFTLPLPPGDATDPASGLARWQHVYRLAPGVQIAAIVADDDRNSREVLVRLLTDLGVEVDQAENGQEALDLATARRPDLIFMDMRMPGMDGRECARRLWERFGKEVIKIVAVSASVFEHERQQVLADGFDDFIPKPFRFERVCACLAELLHAEYTYAPAPAQEEAVVHPSEDFSRIVIPAELYRALRHAAELYSMMDVDRCLEQLAQLGPDGRRIARYLRQFRQVYDMDGMLHAIEGLHHE
jgi:CheY-like chemotaxis protein